MKKYRVVGRAVFEVVTVVNAKNEKDAERKALEVYDAGGVEACIHGSELDGGYYVNDENFVLVDGCCEELLNGLYAEEE